MILTYFLIWRLIWHWFAGWYVGRDLFGMWEEVAFNFFDALFLHMFWRLGEVAKTDRLAGLHAVIWNLSGPQRLSKAAKGSLMRHLN